MNIPKRFIRIWLGPKQIPELFETWWKEFQDMSPDYEFITATDNYPINIPDNIKEIYESVETYAGRSDILRIVLLNQLGGIYVDTDMMPLKSFDSLLIDNRPFLGMRSRISFESAVIGCPKNHSCLSDLIEILPTWYKNNKNNSASVQTGPGLISFC